MKRILEEFATRVNAVHAVIFPHGVNVFARESGNNSVNRNSVLFLVNREVLNPYA
jgi:hypothetical protein